MSDLDALGGIGNSTISALVAAFGGINDAARATGLARSTLQRHVGSIDVGLTPNLIGQIDRALDALDSATATRVHLIQGNLVNFTQAERAIALLDYRQFPATLEAAIEQARQIAQRRGRTLPEWAIRGS